MCFIWKLVGISNKRKTIAGYRQFYVIIITIFIIIIIIIIIIIFIIIFPR